MAIYTVTNTNDSGAGSLRAAVAAAELTLAADTINFSSGIAGGTITLTTGQLVITNELTIDGDSNGDNKADITISGGGNSRVMQISISDVTLDALIITGGNQTGASSADQKGGGIYVINIGDVDIINSTITGNSSQYLGGGLFAAAGTTFDIINSTISNNTSTYGGGLYNLGATTLTNVTVTGNVASGQGGGVVQNPTGSTQITNSTITGNASTTNGGGLYVYNTGTTTVTNSIISGNFGSSAPDTFATVPANLTLTGNNIIGTDIFNGATDVGDTTLANTFANVVVVDPDGAGGHPSFSAGQLADNGGVVQTVAILNGGSAHNSGNDANLSPDTLDMDGDANTAEPTPFDGRDAGFTRTAGQSDIGAFEIALPPNTAPVVDLNGVGGGIDINPSFFEASNQGIGATDGVQIAPSATVTDADVGDNVDTLTITLTNDQQGGDEQLFVDPALLPVGVTVAGNSSDTLTLTRTTGTTTDMQSALTLVRYQNNSDNPTGPAISPSITVVANDGTDNSATATSTISIGADNDAPTFNATLTNLSEAFIFNGSIGDNFGRSVSGAGDVNGDGFADVIVGALQGDYNGINNTGSAQVLSGVDGSVLFNIGGDSANDRFAISVSGAGDVNGDGFADFIVGASLDDNNGLSNSGSARVLSGADGSVLFNFNGNAANDQFGISVSGAGDVNGDGFADVIVGARFDDNNGIGNAGSARVLSGSDGSVLFSFDGDGVNDSLGYSVADAGDVNGDGFADVIVGARFDDNNGTTDSGNVRVLSGADGSVLFSFDGDSDGDLFGVSVSGAGDVNGDGFDDVIVGAHNDDNNGLGNSGSARVLSGLDGSVLFNFNGDGVNDLFGQSVSGVGDVNGDGFADVIVGAYRDDNNGLNNSGSARVLSGADGSVLFNFDGDSAYDLFGKSVSGAGDVNGDGFDDVIIGAYSDDTNGSNSGSARLFTTTGTGRLDSVRAFTEGDAAVVLDGDVAIADAELDDLNGGNGDYNNASLNIARVGGGNADDLFDFAAMANVTVNSGNLEVGGMAIATFTAVGGVLNISFTNAGGTAPTKALVNEVIQAVTYENPVTTLALGETELLPLEWTFSDGANNLTDIININYSGIGGRVLTGTPADDTLNASLGDDTVDGLAANDTLDFGVATAGVTVNLNLTGPQVTGGSGTDTITNIEHLSGGSGNDRFIGKIGITIGDNILSGEGGNDQLFGLGGNDTLNGGDGNDAEIGGAGNDTLNGDGGDDVLKGGDDNDTITGGVGRDNLFGEAGADTFTFNDVSESGLVYLDRDIIRDFSQAEGDLIDLSGIDAVTGGTDDAFTFLGTFPSTIPSIPFTNVAGQLFAVNTAGGQTVVWGDVDGDGTQDFTFVLDGALALTDSDFIL